MILHNPNATVTHIGHFNTQNTTPGVRIMTDGLILRSCFHIYFTTTTTSKTHDFFKRQKWSLNICTFINHLQTTEYPNRLRDVCRPNRPICFLFSSSWSFNCDNVALHILMMRIMEALVEISIWSAQTAFHLPAQQQNTHSKCKSCFYKALIPHIWHWKSNGVHISINNNILQVQNLVYYCI